MFYSNIHSCHFNKYFDTCVLSINWINDPYTYSSWTHPINISYLHSPRDFWEKYKYEKNYLCRNKFYQSYHTQLGFSVPNTCDMPIKSEDGSHTMNKNGHHVFYSIDISTSLNFPISSEYRTGILDLLMPDIK